MIFRIATTLRPLFISGLVAGALALPIAPARAQLATEASASCVGGSIGCSQVDLFFEFLNLTTPTTLDGFTLSIRDVFFRFAAPGLTEAEDALGLNFYNPEISSDGRTLSGSFDFGAFLDPNISSVLRVRAEMLEFSSGGTADLALTYAFTTSGETVARGEVVPLPTTATPEPATVWLLGTGLIGVGGMAMRKRSNAGRIAETVGA